MVGIFIIILDGIWVVKTYDSYDVYPKETFFLLLLGACLMILAYGTLYIRKKHLTPDLNKIKDTESEEETNSQLFVNRMWEQRETVGGKLLLFVLTFLALLAIFDWGLALNMLQPILFVGMIVYSFFYIMHDDTEDASEDEFRPKSNIMLIFLRLIDYRKHPFSIGLFLFTGIVLTLLLAKHFNFNLSLETGGNPRYVMSLPTSAFILSGLTVACGLFYISQQCHFFGLSQKNRGTYKLFQIHFYEIVICGATFFIWLTVVVLTWVIG
ncbi:hypothetical protein N6H13_30760 [Paenibacillus sp. CC-CFT742]|uniref:hypothetical protein n=1 Tax=Paenibacillus illinoisensis TaxID=59845 RepID=UPI00203F118D|nr:MULTISPECIES: hypothetical protein [Paenibacillus]WJH29194.1 hypothetical protein N6H13_30760 [Paenibacillus sp. CC-CFT742]